MQKHGVKPDCVSYSTLVHACATSGDAVRAKGLREKMNAEGFESGKPKAFLFNAVVQAWAKQGIAEGASHWFSRMVKARARSTTQSLVSVISVWKQVVVSTQTEKPNL